MNDTVIIPGCQLVNQTEEELHEEFIYSLWNGEEINYFEMEAKRQVTGLSTLHIRRKDYLTQDEKERQLSAGVMNSVYYQKRKGKIELSVNGNWVSAKVPVTKPLSRKNGGLRSHITGFSVDSRRRMMRMISKLENVKKPIFFTLTYPDEFENNLDGGVLKEKHLKKFWQRFEYKYPGSSSVWKLEFQDRKSGSKIGELFPHFHLLVWGVYSIDIEELREYVSEAWWAVCGELSADHRQAGTRVERLRSINGVMSYVSKYMGKEEEADLKVGRFWGVKNKKDLPIAQIIVIDFLEKEQYLKVINFMRVYANLPEGRWNSLQIFMDGNKLLQMLEFIIFGS